MSESEADELLTAVEDEADDEAVIPLHEKMDTESVEPLVSNASTGLFESEEAREAFTDGMDTALAERFAGLVASESGVGSDAGVLESVVEPSGAEIAVTEWSVDETVAEDVLKAVFMRLDEYQRSYHELPAQIVLGVPQYKAVAVAIGADHTRHVERELPVDEVIVVPGPQMYCVRSPVDVIADTETDAEVGCDV